MLTNLIRTKSEFTKLKEIVLLLSPTVKRQISQLGSVQNVEQKDTE